MNMLLILFTVFSFVCLVPFDYSYCLPETQSQLLVTSLDISPQQPKPGDTLVVNFVGVVSSSPISSGDLVTTVKKIGITIMTYHYDFCKVMIDGCPADPGANKGNFTHVVPRLMLPGWYNLTASLKTNEKEISCVTTSIHLTW